MKTQLEKFLSKLPPRPDEGCWEWFGAISNRGYGHFGTPTISAHRFSYEYFIGPIPIGLHVLHRCDNRRCQEPRHLFTGTQSDNNQDMASKGRAPKQLSVVVENEIYSLYKTGSMNQPQLADRYNVVPSTISKIVRRVERYRV